MTSAPTTWVLTDEKASHRSQLLGVMDRLGWAYVLKELAYNRFAELANGPFGARCWHLRTEARKALTEPWPNLVLAAGRRSAPVALWIKKRSSSTTIVQLMWPDAAPHRFDLICVPEQDKITYQGANLVRTFGAPHQITPKKLKEEAKHWQKSAARLPKPYLALLVGGQSRNMRYMPDDFKTLAAYAAAEAERLGGSLLVTSSPRTGQAGEALIKPLLTAPHIFHSFSPGAANPYAGFLGMADAIIVTADSVSMCSEAASARKPLYIFTPPHLAKDRNSLSETLIAQGTAKPHTFPIRLDWQPNPIPDAAQTVADAIRKLLIHEPIAA